MLCFQAGSYYLTLKPKGKWQEFDTVTRLTQLRLTENFKLPVFWGTSVDYAYEKQTFTIIQKEEAKARALDQAKSTS